MRLKDENWMKNSVKSLEPRSERSSRVALCPNPFFNENVVFDHEAIRTNIRFHRKAFQANAGVFSRTFIVKNISNSLTYTVASSCVCTSPLAVMTVVGTTRFRQSIHFSVIRVLFADHMHRRSGVHNKFSFLRFQS